MPLFHHVTIFAISENEKADFLAAGIEFKTVTRGSRGEAASFEIGEDDARWRQVLALMASLEARDGIPKEYRVQDLSMTEPTFEATLEKTKERIAAFVGTRPGLPFLSSYSGQSPEELLSLESAYRIDCLVLAFEEAVGQKARRQGPQSLSNQELIVLAVEALEREVNNGGYEQFFINSSKEFAPIMVEALGRIGCGETSKITQKAIEALGVAEITPNAIEDALSNDNEERAATLRRLDDSYFESSEPIAERLFAFIKANKSQFTF